MPASQIEVQRGNDLAFLQDLNIRHILSNPIMDIAARVWETERYEAAKICYESMRAIDDLIDTNKSVDRRLSRAEKQKLTIAVNEWIGTIENGIANGSTQSLLLKTMRRFHIPLRPLQVFAKSMFYDIHHNGFKTFPAFLRYAEGAAVAPASIFMHLCGVIEDNDHYNPPQFDIVETARPAGIFCYLVHIIRDFQEDSCNNLNYFADSLMTENGLTKSLLKKIAAGDAVPPGFRTLIRKYSTFTEHYRGKTRAAFDQVGEFLEPRYRLSLEIVYNLYLLVFEQFDVEKSRFTTAELTPSPKSVENRLKLTINSFRSALRG